MNNQVTSLSILLHGVILEATSCDKVWYRAPGCVRLALTCVFFNNYHITFYLGHVMSCLKIGKSLVVYMLHHDVANIHNEEITMLFPIPNLYIEAILMPCDRAYKESNIRALVLFS